MTFAYNNNKISEELHKGTYYTTTGKAEWLEVSSADLAARLATRPPAFRTVLAVTRKPEDEGRAEGWAYMGPAYFDLDAEDIAEACAALRKLLDKVEALGVDLNMARIFATGGRGYHLELPPALFVPVLPPEGIEHLPRIYREMALALYVDCMDLAVYSGRKGRQWRVPGVRRDNGAFKVPLTLGEARRITPETYAELCAAPRPLPRLKAPALVPALAALYVKARDKAHAKATRTRTAGKVAKGLQHRFKGGLPPSLLGLAQGAFPARAGAGWNLIALQLGTVAHAIGMPEDTLIAACRGLIDRHEGDGHRYGTPRRREAELRRIFAYTESAPYDPSLGGIRSILPERFPANDLRGL